MSHQQISPQLWIPLAVTAVVLLLLAALTGRLGLRYNLRNLLVRWRTTLLTALAFTAVVGLLTVMLAFVNGMDRLTQSSGQPENVIILSEGVTDEGTSNLGFSDIGDLENQSGVARENARPLCSRETYLVVNQPIPDAAEGRPKRRFLQLRGIDDPWISSRVHNLKLLEGGRWFSAAGVQALAAGQAAAIEIVLGEGIARELARDRGPMERAGARNAERLEVGDTFVLGDRQWVVVGLMESSGSVFDSEVWAKRAVIGPMFGKEQYTSLVLRAADVAAARTLTSFFNTEYKKAAVQAQLETEYFAGLSQTNRQFLYAVRFVTLIMAIGGVLGVMNTMFAAVSQRTKDVGVLRMLGFPRWKILASFLLESLMIALLGGVIGCAIGLLANGWTATSVVGTGPGGGGKFVVLRLAVDANTIAAGLLITVIMGVLGGLVPSVHATRLRPLEALR